MTSYSIREAEMSVGWEIVIHGEFFLDGTRMDRMYIPDWADRDFISEEHAELFVKDFIKYA